MLFLAIINVKMYMYIQVILYIVAALATVYLFSKRRPKKGKTIPGPTGLPVIGFGHKINMKTLHSVFFDLAKRYGAIFQFNSFGGNVIVVNSGDMVRSLFCDEQYKRFTNDRPTLFWSDKLAYKYKGIFATLGGFNSPHGVIRKTFVRGMHVYGEGIAAFEGTVHSELEKLNEQLESFRGKEFDIQPIIEYFLNNVVSLLLSGQPVGDEETMQMFREFNRGTNVLLNPVANLVLSTIPVLRFVPGPYKQAFNDALRARDALVQRYVENAKRTYQSGQVRGIVDFYLNEQSLEKNDHVSDEQVYAMVITTLFAAVESTLSHLTSFVLCMMNNPEYQEKMQEEIDRIVGQDRLPMASDKHDCVFIEAVSLEVHRFIPSAPVPTPHVCQQNIEFNGYDIPANSILQPNAWFIYHDEKIWGDPWTFRPERWIDGDGTLLPNDHVLRKNLLPFGTGRRQCVGESLARSRVFLFVATLLQRWNFEMPPEHAVPCDPRLGNMNFDLLCRPKPYLCRAVPRKPKQ